MTTMDCQNCGAPFTPCSDKETTCNGCHFGAPPTAPIEAAEIAIVARWRKLGCGGQGRAAMDVMDDEDAPYMAGEAIEALCALPVAVRLAAIGLDYFEASPGFYEVSG